MKRVVSVYGEPAHWCARCDRLHILPVFTEPLVKRFGQRLIWNGDLVNPTFSGSKSDVLRASDTCQYTLKYGLIHYHGEEDPIPLSVLPSWVSDHHKNETFNHPY